MISDAVKYEILAKIKSRTYHDKISGAKLGDSFGLNSVQVRKIVNHFRSKEHLPIASTTKGYWWATETWHLDKTDEHLESRIIGIQNARTGIKIAREEMVQGKFL